MLTDKEDVEAIITSLKNAPNEERDRILGALTFVDVQRVVTSIADIWLASDETRRLHAISPLLASIAALSAQQREAAAYNLILTGWFATPYLEQLLLHEPGSKLIQCILYEIEHLECSVTESLESLVHNLAFRSPVSGFVESGLVEQAMLATNRYLISANEAEGHTEVADARLISFIQVHVDAWIQARNELLTIAAANASPLAFALRDNDVYVRLVAVKLLRIIGAKRASKTLLAAVNDMDVIVRDEAIVAMSGACDLEQATAFISAYIQHFGKVGTSESR